MTITPPLPTLTNPFRAARAEFAPTANVKLPFPICTVDWTLMKESRVVAIHAQVDGAETLTLLVPPRAGAE